MMNKKMLRKPQTLHPYIYCINSPVRYVDPFGLYSRTPDDYWTGMKECREECKQDLQCKGFPKLITGPICWIICWLTPAPRESPPQREYDPNKQLPKEGAPFPGMITFPEAD